MSQIHRYFRGPAWFALLYASVVTGQKLSPPTRVWSVGPLTKGMATMSIALGRRGVTLAPARADFQTGSAFAATRRVVFAGDRVVLASMVEMRRVEGFQTLVPVYQLLSLDAQTGKVHDSREILGDVSIFATADTHVIVAGSNVLRLTPDLKEAGSFDYQARGHRFGRISTISPDGTTLGNSTSPGLELVDSKTLEARALTDSPITETSVSSNAALTDNLYWYKEYPKAKSFATLFDRAGEHLVFHGDCGGRPQFLRDDRILLASCKMARILDLQGNFLATITQPDSVAFAGVPQNGKRFALQVARFSSMHSATRERFVVYSLDTAKPLAEVLSEGLPEKQSWTAFSPDGTMFVVGSPQNLTLYRLP